MHSARLVSFFATLLAAATFPAIAATPPVFPDAALPARATMQTMPAAAMKLGNLQLRFGETTLHAIAAAANTGAISHQGDAGDSIYWLCYTRMDRTSTDRIWFISGGEMGGENHAVTAVIARRLAKQAATADCPLLPAGMQRLSLDSGIWLDTASDSLRRKLGPPSATEALWRSYSYQGKIPGQCSGGGFDVSNVLTVQLQQGRVGTLWVNHVLSC